MRLRIERRILASAVVGVALLAVVGCGSSGGSSGGGSLAPGSGGTTEAAVFVKDMTPVPLSDGRVMHELFLRATAVDLVDDAGNVVAVPLGAPFVDFDLLTLDQTATLLAVGPVPTAVYEQLVLTLDQTACHFIDAAGVNQPLVVPDPVFEVDFQPPLDTAVSATIVLDIRPDRIVVVVVPGAEYHLESSVDALVAGPPGSAPGIPGSIPVIEVEGTITALAAPILTLNGAVDVDTSNATITDDDTGAVLAFADLAVGDEVEVEGTLQSSGVITADEVEVEDASSGGSSGSGSSGSGGSGNGDVDLDGEIANLDAAATPPSFDLVRGGVTVAHVEIAAGAEIEDEPTDTLITVADLADGDAVEVEGVVTSAAGAPLVLEAEEVERQ